MYSQELEEENYSLRRQLNVALDIMYVQRRIIRTYQGYNLSDPIPSKRDWEYLGELWDIFEKERLNGETS